MTSKNLFFALFLTRNLRGQFASLEGVNLSGYYTSGVLSVQSSGFLYEKSILRIIYLCG